MATDVDRSCYGWSREDLDDQDDSREISISQMLDHGSISFGRFDLEPLSWEKRSVFTHNRYQEELEKCKAPGLVAQKKAYFEEYYKRIRTMKTLQQNQHTELESTCGHNNGVSEKIREDERVVPYKSDVDEMIKTVGLGVEKVTTEVSLDVDGETALVKLDSPANISKENKNGESPPNSKHWKILDIYSYHHEPITSIADSELHEFIKNENKLEPREIISGSITQQIGVENQRVIGKKSHGDELDYVIGTDRENASIEVPLSMDVETALLETDPPVNSSEDDKMAENSQNSKQFQLLDQNSCDHEPITASIEDYKQQDFISQANEVISKKTENFVPNDSFYSSSSHKILKEKLNAKPKKEHSYVAGDFVNSELKSKSVTVMLTQVLRDSSQKRNGKKNVCIISHKQTVDRILSSKYATVASHESNKERHSKITTPRPFSFASGKQAAVSISASARYDAKNILSSSSLPPKNTNSKAVSSRPGMPYSQKRGKLESSGHEPRRQPLVTSGQATHLKGASANNVIRPPKARSINLPTSSCKGGKNVGTNSNGYRRINEDGKQKTNDETCLMEVRAQGKSTIVSVISKNPNPDNIKMARSRIKDLLSINTKNSQLGDSSLVRRKLRPEKPRWR